MGTGFFVAGVICLPLGVALGIYRRRNWKQYIAETPPVEIPWYFFGSSGTIPWGSRWHKWAYVGSAFAFGLAGLWFMVLGGAAMLDYIEF